MTYAIETLEKELYLINRCLSDNPEVRLKQFERINDLANAIKILRDGAKN